ncbi:MAG: hypothetical protein IRZ08_21850 [Frankia sp.]|nr:hypothetical protein [Frankia sp.]
MIAALIVGCEIAFWVLVALGLAARYLLRWRRTGLVLLATTPVVDLVLLVATWVDLRGGAEVGPFHGLAAIYLGYSVAYGHKMIRWADVRFAHRFAGGPPPVRLYGREHARECWRNVGRTAIAVSIAAAGIGLLATQVTHPDGAGPLLARYPLLGILLVADIIWAASHTVSPRKPKPSTS